MKRHLSLAVSLAALAVSACVLVLALGDLAAPPAAASDPVNAYRLEKLNEVNDMVLHRQIVPEPYLHYLDEALSQAVEEYNYATAALKSSYSGYAEDIAQWVFSYEPPAIWWEGYPSPEYYYQFIDRLSTLALFRNIWELSLTDPVTSYPATMEAGGSHGLWAWALHEDFHVGESLAQQAEDYFTLTDNLLVQLESARGGAGLSRYTKD